MSRKKIGLALGSGGTRGLAIIGILKVLEENNIPIDYIAGSSVGSIVGGAYAINRDLEKIKDISLKINEKDIFESMSDVSFKGGLFQGDKFLKVIERYIGDHTFKELEIPFCAVATNQKSGETVEIYSGKLADAMRASSSIPVFFTPFKTSTTDSDMIDGGLSLQVPVQVVRKMGADIVIAVNLSEHVTNYDSKNGISMIQHYFLLLFHNLARENVKTADIVIAPHYDNVDWLDNLKNRTTLIAEGERVARNAIPQIRELLS